MSLAVREEECFMVLWSFSYDSTYSKLEKSDQDLKYLILLKFHKVL